MSVAIVPSSNKPLTTKHSNNCQDFLMNAVSADRFPMESGALRC